MSTDDKYGSSDGQTMPSTQSFQNENNTTESFLVIIDLKFSYLLLIIVSNIDKSTQKSLKMFYKDNSMT